MKVIEMANFIFAHNDEVKVNIEKVYMKKRLYV